MLVDLVSPWAAAVEAKEAVHATATFRRRHADLLEELRRQRAPLADALPLAGDRARLRALATRAADPGVLQRIRDAATAATAHLGGIPARIVLIAGNGTGDPIEPLPDSPATLALFLDRIDDDEGVATAAARGAAALTRWLAPDSASPLRTRGPGRWDRWLLARGVPLAEWLYAEGVGLHLAQALRPGLPGHRLLGINSGAFRRLREQERTLRAALAGEMHRSGIDLVLRWLAPTAAAAGPAPRTPLPAEAGRYLAWRLTADRVGRVGVHQAIRMAAT